MEGHWEEVGSLIASLIIGLFEDFNPEEFARGVIAFLDGLWDAFMGFVETPGWDQVVDKIQKAIVTFAEEFEWEGKVDGLITFLNNAIGALVDILDRLDLPKLFDEIYTELSESEEFQELCDKIVQLFIDYLTKLKTMDKPQCKSYFLKKAAGSMRTRAYVAETANVSILVAALLMIRSL